MQDAQDSGSAREIDIDLSGKTMCPRELHINDRNQNLSTTHGAHKCLDVIICNLGTRWQHGYG